VHDERDEIVLQRLQVLQVLQLAADHRVLLTHLEERLHAQQQFAPVHRLRQEVVGAGGQARVAIVLLAQRGEQEDGQESFAAALADEAARVEAGELRHHDVQEHRDRRPRARASQDPRGRSRASTTR
jgi:hypothetical protein